ncbi:MAG: aldo/keto reductase [Elainella sp. Prado103]|nr:aldo/keto reductase [Elainella sp. Prado103]
MKYKLLGRSGLRVSEICLGCSTFGTNWGTVGVDQETSRQIFETFVEAGGNFFDTSNRYQESQSEAFLSEFIHPIRDQLVIGTKYSLFDGFSNFDDPNGCGNHRKNLVRSVEQSLKRLNTDYIDLLWVHIQDHTTPVDEMLRALDDLVRQGKILYIGISNFPAWWIARANTIADYQGWSPFIATQIEWSVVERSAEPEFLPMADALDLALVSWSPLGGGIATGKYHRGALDPKQIYRLAPQLDPQRPVMWTDVTQRNLMIMEQFVKLADAIGKPPAQVALRWLMQQPVVTIPISAARSVEQITENLAACDFMLTDEELRQIDQITRPAIASVMPEVGPYPYPMLEYGSPALPGFYSRMLLFGNVENKIINHRRKFPYRYNPASVS